ncbi:hypothetical protein COCCADRAFT_110589 [Bipolaris zeicola 26-R-13]|uniref:Uncharacterized protein n=1 Tax=Cochliobolus carbonum (strain 26-R-13) TaxID=930089 RepID=W6XRD5_COCC2|nr:uncharacterized protein COCCADRAFT_110589 [Bipolaris zeicola 26-R-13]EUC27880.1 hypothetical protein COCCADRAFT_110589 [Bipolaris zeicola 26-R-13]
MIKHSSRSTGCPYLYPISHIRHHPATARLGPAYSATWPATLTAYTKSRACGSK